MDIGENRQFGTRACQHRGGVQNDGVPRAFDFPVEFVGNRPPAISLTAAMNGGALNREIPENELKTGLFSSGFNGHGNPIALLYLEKPESTGAQERSE